MDNELLQRILRDNSRVIIPGFGAFLRKEQGGALIFSPFLRSDDGMLRAILEIEYGVSAAEAAAMMGEYSERVRTILKVKSKYYIDGVGMLLVDNNGVVSFVEEKAPPVVAAPAPVVAPQPMPQITPPPAPAPAPAPQQAVRQPIAAPPQPAPAPVAAPAPRVVPAAPNSSPFARPAAPAPAPMPTAPRPVAAPKAPRPAGAPVPTGQPIPGVPQKGPRPGAPARKPTKKSKKSDMWLVIAIVAAAVVVILMVIGILNTSQLPPIE